MAPLDNSGPSTVVTSLNSINNFFRLKMIKSFILVRIPKFILLLKYFNPKFHPAPASQPSRCTALHQQPD